ncbi:MAG: insulinase family protein [Candidatus Eisenbacteria bacterium]|nr:insulinase family protein [Candidatus Eisenbacteria bacterium]
MRLTVHCRRHSRPDPDSRSRFARSRSVWPRSVARFALAAFVALAGPRASFGASVAVPPPHAAALPSPRLGSGLPPLSVPAPVTRTLENGLKVAVFPVHRWPIVQIELRVAAGQVAEGGSAAGVSYLTAQMLTRGTSSRDAATFAADAARIGGNVSATASRDYATLVGAFLSDRLGPAMELLSDAALNPVFTDDEMNATLSQARQMLERLHGDPSVTSSEQIWAVLFGDHPYGRSPLGVDSTLLALTHEQVRAFHHDRYRPEGSLLVVAGDVSPDSVFAAASEWFGRWSGRATEVPAAVRVASAARSRVRIVDMPELPYTVLRLGARLPGRGSEDEVPLTLAASELVGGAFAWLGRPEFVRRLGSTVNGSLLTLHDGGLFSFGAVVPTDSVASAIELLRAETRGFIQHPPIEDEMKSIRLAAETGTLAPLETLGGLIAQWAGGELQGPGGSTRGTLERLAALRPADISAAAARWLDPDRLSIVAVGPAGPLRSALARFGDVEVVSVVHGPLPNAADTVAATPENTAMGREIMDRAIRAHGGLEALRAIHDSRVDLDVGLFSGQHEARGSITQLRKEPDRMVSLIRFGKSDQRQILAGDRAWTQSSEIPVPQPADSTTLAGLKASFASDLPHLLLAAVQEGVRSVSRGPDRIEQRAVDAVDVRLGDGQRRRYFFDAESHLLAAIEFFERGAAAGATVARRYYGAYRDAGSLKWPYSEERYINGVISMRLHVSALVLNPGVSDREFEIQPSPAPSSRP